VPAAKPPKPNGQSVTLQPPAQQNAHAAAQIKSSGKAEKTGAIKSVSAAAAKAKAAKKSNAAPAGKRQQASYPIQKPKKSQFVRVHPGSDYRQFGVLTLKLEDDDTVYYVDPDLELPEHVANLCAVTNLYAAQLSDGTFFIWPVNQSGSKWYKSALTAIRVATEKWVAVAARKAANTYDLITPEDTIPEPDWSALPPFAEMVAAGFADSMITFIDHEVIRKLRGFQDDPDAE